MMKAIGFTRSLPIDHAHSLVEFEAVPPVLREHDLLVRVQAVSVNPVDAKVRRRAAADCRLDRPQIPGYDAVGIVEALGPRAAGFDKGERAWYPGEIGRDGSNAEYQAVDSRIVAHAPRSLSETEAAALPLTALPGWEALFDRLRVDRTEDKTLLIIGGAGGVGSITTQIARQLTGLTVIPTASRPETAAWVRTMGADQVADHRDLVASVKALGFESVDYIFNTADTKGHWEAMAELVAPQGMICAIVELDGMVDLCRRKEKSAGFVWELMFTHSLYGTRDMARQQQILAQLARLVDAGRIRSTLTETLEGLCADTFKEAHRRIEGGRTIGKIAVR